MRARRGPGAAAHGPRSGGLGGGGYPATDHDPIDKGKVNGVVFDLLDHLDEWYGRDAEIGHVLVAVRVTDAGGGRCTDVVTSPGTPKDEALDMLGGPTTSTAGRRRGRGAAGTSPQRSGAPWTPTKRVKMDTLEELKVQKVPSALTVAIGLVLMAGKVYADSEPGAIPILLVVLGAGWYLLARARTRSRRR